MFWRAALALGLFLPLSSMPGQTESVAPTPSDAEIRQILIDRIDRDHQGVGIAVGVVDAKGRRIIAYGSLAKGDSRQIDGDTVFEIGSVTKVFTSLLLMDMVQRGEVALTDPVSRFLPSNVKMPERNGKRITLADLSTQTSGLPLMPANMNPKEPMSNPYADYTVDQLYQFLSGFQLTRDIGSQYEYSNLGVGLLGHVLALRAGSSYEDLVRSRITKPLDMSSTSIALSPVMEKRLAVGHDGALNPVANWDMPTLAGCGALRSTANDLLNFLAANLGYRKTSLAAAMAAELSTRRPTGTLGMEIAYGWHITTAHGTSIIGHNGLTGGYKSFIGFDPRSGVGVVVLSNSNNGDGPYDIGRHLLNINYPLAKIEPPREHRKAKIDTKVFDRYIGRYETAPDSVLTITRDGDHLDAEAPHGGGTFEILPESETEFFVSIKGMDIELTFHTVIQSNATELVVNQEGQKDLAKRVEEKIEPAKERKEAKVDPKVFDRYIGRYELSPNFILTITRDGDYLFAQATGQGSLEIFPESETEFFAKITDLQITFQTAGRQDRAMGLVVHQLGRNTAAKSLEGGLEKPK
jgi:serine-type D-Ala-D-Ala carboxypeptidase/endopeptidase